MNNNHHAGPTQPPPALDDHFSRVAEAFSRKSEEYDLFGSDHPNLIRLRYKVYNNALRFLKPGDRILEINSGTGVDAVYFANQGYSIHAIDIAQGMLAHLQQKIDRYQLADQITVENCSFTQLDRVGGKPYSYIFSNFGGLNCIKDLREVTQHLPSVLSPGGKITWVIMPKVCLWELALVFKGDFKHGLRRLRPQGTLANVEGVHFMTYYFNPRQVVRVLGPDFQILNLEGLSVFTPPADRKNFALRFPRLFNFLSKLDDALSPVAPFNRWGDFFILTAQYNPK
ncbi:MAG: class I SAM-dependent methyltransferase [Anaerolineaceae bacterium]|nr:class I SAM-dependent methyltransferase [Anaerolineaceae bacterium]